MNDPRISAQPSQCRSSALPEPTKAFRPPHMFYSIRESSDPLSFEYTILPHAHDLLRGHGPRERRHIAHTWNWCGLTTCVSWWLREEGLRRLGLQPCLHHIEGCHCIRLLNGFVCEQKGYLLVRAVRVDPVAAAMSFA
jgi:hypothetical protein